jgi:hypothetical protein
MCGKFIQAIQINVCVCVRACARAHAERHIQKFPEWVNN